MLSGHEGHRSRLRKRLLSEGEKLTEPEMLEALLFYVIPRQDVRPLAEELLRRFGSLSGVMEAESAELMKVPGLGEQGAALLRLIPKISRRYYLSRSDSRKLLQDSDAAGDYVVPRLMFAQEEIMLLLLLDANSHLLRCVELYRGEPAASALSVRRVVELALEARASRVVLAHNHVSGIALPSKEDVDATKLVRDALAPVGVVLADHLVVAGDDYVSMRDSDML